MKSIKEKAEEYADDFYKALGLSEDECPVDVELTKADFDAGANYVLDEIEKLIKFNRWSAQDLYNLIEKLKSNQ